MSLLKEHLFYEDCDDKDHNNWDCLLNELFWDGEAIEYYQNQGVISSIDEWIENTLPYRYFRAAIFLHNPTGQYYWIYEDLKSGDGSYDGDENWSWIELGNGTIQDWICAVKDIEKLVDKLP